VLTLRSASQPETALRRTVTSGLTLVDAMPHPLALAARSGRADTPNGLSAHRANG
jgi:hypothetical protein